MPFFSFFTNPIFLNQQIIELKQTFLIFLFLPLKKRVLFSGVHQSCFFFVISILFKYHRQKQMAFGDIILQNHYLCLLIRFLRNQNFFHHYGKPDWPFCLSRFYNWQLKECIRAHVSEIYSWKKFSNKKFKRSFFSFIFTQVPQYERL